MDPLTAIDTITAVATPQHQPLGLSVLVRGTDDESIIDEAAVMLARMDYGDRIIGRVLFREVIDIASKTREVILQDLGPRT